MIGIIISGHGHFASGLRTSLKLIAGEPSNVEYVDFEDIDTTETLKEKYITALNKLNNCEHILALTDLAGGSPFKTLVELSVETSQEIKVIGGSNLPMILEITLTKDIIEDLSALCDIALDIGKNSIVKFDLIDHTDDDLECEDGI